jgi:hypothetical protein
LTTRVPDKTILIDSVATVLPTIVAIIAFNGNLLSVNSPIRWRPISFSMPGAIWSLS